MYIIKLTFYAYVIVNLIVIFSFPAYSKEFGDQINITNNSDIIETMPSIVIENDNHVHIVWTFVNLK